VYILIIPGFGIVSHVISKFAGKPIFGQDGPMMNDDDPHGAKLRGGRHRASSQQTISRKFKWVINLRSEAPEVSGWRCPNVWSFALYNLILQNTIKNKIWNPSVPSGPECPSGNLIVKSFVILNNPQVTKALDPTGRKPNQRCGYPHPGTPFSSLIGAPLRSSFCSADDLRRGGSNHEAKRMKIETRGKSIWLSMLVGTSEAISFVINYTFPSHLKSFYSLLGKAAIRVSKFTMNKNHETEFRTYLETKIGAPPKTTPRNYRTLGALLASHLATKGYSGLELPLKQQQHISTLPTDRRSVPEVAPRKELQLNPELTSHQWLAGLIDGAGCLKLSKKGYATLEIVMEIKDKHCLYQIKQKFGGSVKLKSGIKWLRYKVHHKKGLLKLISCVNGEIRNPIRLLELNKFCGIYNIPLIQPKPLTFENGWFSGFFDSKGSVVLKENSTNSSVSLVISVSHINKYLLDPLLDLYGGGPHLELSKQNFTWVVSKTFEITKLLDYFKLCPSRSTKHKRLKEIKRFNELKNLKAYSAGPHSILGKSWSRFKKKFDSRGYSTNEVRRDIQTHLASSLLNRGSPLYFWIYRRRRLFLHIYQTN